MDHIPFSIHLPEHLLKQVEDQADERDMSVASFIEHSLNAALSNGFDNGDTHALIEHICRLQEQKTSLVESIKHLAKSLEKM